MALCVHYTYSLLLFWHSVFVVLFYDYYQNPKQTTHNFEVNVPY